MWLAAYILAYLLFLMLFFWAAIAGSRRSERETRARLSAKDGDRDSPLLPDR